MYEDCPICNSDNCKEIERKAWLITLQCQECKLKWRTMDLGGGYENEQTTGI